jgi:hypothetical protein
MRVSAFFPVSTCAAEAIIPTEWCWRAADRVHHAKVSTRALQVGVGSHNCGLPWVAIGGLLSVAPPAQLACAKSVSAGSGSG